MPPKGKPVHTTRSVTARSHSNSPHRVKVQNNLARTKTKECNKQPLKSVVKVVNKQAKAKSVSFSNQDSAFHVDNSKKFFSNVVNIDKVEII